MNRESIKSRYFNPNNDKTFVLRMHGDSNVNVYTKRNTLLAEGYNRVVKGSYGTFLEIKPSNIKLNMVQSIEEYGATKPYHSKLKYYKLRTKDNSSTRVLYQTEESSYVDHRVGFYYVLVKEVVVRKKEEYIEVEEEIGEDMKSDPIIDEKGIVIASFNTISGVVGKLIKDNKNLTAELESLKGKLNDPNFLIARLETLMKESK